MRCEDIFIIYIYNYYVYIYTRVEGLKTQGQHFCPGDQLLEKKNVLWTCTNTLNKHTHTLSQQLLEGQRQNKQKKKAAQRKTTDDNTRKKKNV